MHWKVIFCVWSMDHRTAWTEWKMLLDAEISVFTLLYRVFRSLQYHPPLHVRENCPFRLRRNGQTMGSDNWFWRLSATIFKQFVGTSFLHSKALNDDWKSDSWWPSTHIVFRKQNNVKTPLSEMKMLATQYIDTVWRFFFACKLYCLKQSFIWCHFHSTRMTTEEFLYPTHCLLKVCFWGYVHLRHSHGKIRHGNQ